MYPILTNINGLTNDQIESQFPAVFADHAHPSTSERYLHIPTYELLDGMRDREFTPTSVVQSMVKEPGMAAYAQHLIRFRENRDLGSREPNVHEVLIRNAHFGHAYDVMSGVFRIVCGNGLVTGDKDSSIHVAHRGNALDAIFEATYEIAQRSIGIMQVIELLRQIMLSPDEQIIMAQAAMMIRFHDKVVVSEVENEETGETEPSLDMSLVPYQPQDFLVARNHEDQPIGRVDNRGLGERGLYETFNVLQQNMVEGGISRRSRGHRHTTKGIKSIGPNVALNQALWTMTRTMAQLKTQGDH